MVICPRLMLTVHGVEHHPRIGQIKRCGAEQTEDKTPAIAA
jgi:hypothetical protein